jgi:hypothetical protein
MLRPAPRRPVNISPPVRPVPTTHIVVTEDREKSSEEDESVSDEVVETVSNLSIVDPARDIDAIYDGEQVPQVFDKDQDDVSRPVRENGSIYFGECRLLNWTTTAKGGMKADLAILDCPADAVHPFKGLLCGKQNGQRLRVWFGELAETNIPMQVNYQGEALLLRWSDDSVNGMNTQVMLDDGPDGVKGKHPFTGLPIGRVEGHRMKMAVWAVNDDESVIDPRKVKRKVPFYQKPETTQAHILSRNPRFISYVKRHEKRLARGQEIRADITIAPDEYIAEALYAILGITSRSELGDENAVAREARRRWSSLVGEYFDDYYGRR